MSIAKAFGEFFKQKRVGLGLTLREFCRINGFDPGNISKLERGLHRPPQSTEKRLQYAKALGIQEGTDEWLEFCDLAVVSAGKIPAYIASNERLMNTLPILFRAIRRKALDEEDLKGLVNSIKRELQ